MADSSADNTSQREEELDVLSSIYPSSQFQRVPGEYAGVCYASPDLDDGIMVQFTEKDDQPSSPSRFSDLSLSHLPDIALTFQLPETYPETTGPEYTLACKWLTPQQLTKVCQKLDELYLEVCDAIIFNWLQFLRDDVLDFLSMTEKRGDSMYMTVSVLPSRAGKNAAAAAADGVDMRACQDVGSIAQLHRAMRAHNEDQRAVAFASAYHDCEVCFITQPGEKCIQFLPCHHAFCKECMKSYFEVQIAEGAVTSLHCPAGKCESQALPTQVQALVSQEQYGKYERLLLQRGLESMEEIVLCPARICQQPVVKDGGDSNMATCAACKLSFCILCRRVWHGVNPCSVSNSEKAKLVKKYQSGTKEERAALLKVYGSRITRYVEESISEEWLTENSKACPSCGSHIQKTEGCNKMTCRRCRNNFCWMCLANLNRHNPYSHFSQQGSPCYNRLFDGMLDEDGEQDWWVGAEEIMEE
ncbi:E3 ubiquitin-protein ligase RNF14-like [Sycon ciliatum]|uniref:E3 ubiquitin-protein ligase RNF14-like n=1 Tax=Sycon ciliatum TaxID=27933 RepID=UPI0031F6A3AE